VKTRQWALFGLFCIAFASVALSQRTEPFILGADVSWIPEEEGRGVRYSDNGVQKDIFQILKDHKFNYIRLRIFHNPAAPSGGSAQTTGAVYAGYSSRGYCGLDSTMKMARRIKAAGMKFSLDFHYSDNWADPGKQYKPHAWANATFTELVDSVRTYTRAVITALKDQGTPPDMVQVGNEITGGMIWPDGRSSNWANLGTLLKAGIAGVKDVDSGIKIVMHIDKGGDNAATRNWVDNAVKQGVAFDIFGESCYTQWQGPPSGWRTNFTDLVTRYPQYRFIIAEYSWEKRAANDVMFDLPDGKGLGTFIWEPLQYAEPFFNNTGNNWTAINSLIDLYPEMSKDYGSDTFTTHLIPPRQTRNGSGYSIVNAPEWARGSGPLRVFCPVRTAVCLRLLSAAGKTIRVVHGSAAEGTTSMHSWTGWGRIPPGPYVLRLDAGGRVRAVAPVMK
jgi:arabinogalactan endo-1,4-beta-galactosidase